MPAIPYSLPASLTRADIIASMSWTRRLDSDEISNIEINNIIFSRTSTEKLGSTVTKFQFLPLNMLQVSGMDTALHKTVYIPELMANQRPLGLRNKKFYHTSVWPPEVFNYVHMVSNHVYCTLNCFSVRRGQRSLR